MGVFHLLPLLLALLVQVTSTSARLQRLRSLNSPQPLLPTPAQARWQHDEIMALVHFNMATFAHNGDPGCNSLNWNGCDPGGGGCNTSNPATFAPTALNVSNWVDSMLALGVTEAVLTAKHGCGFYLWPTNVTLPSGARYPYAVNSSLDVLRLFTDTLTSRGLGAGTYYSLTNNFFLNEGGFVVRPPSTLLPGQAQVTQQEFEAIALASLAELWGGGGYGQYREIWLDGGYPSALQGQIVALLGSLQPQALVLNGEGVTASSGRWSGTEGNVPPGWPNVFSTTCCNTSGNDAAHACEGSGCAPDAPNALYAPSSTDFTLQAQDTWFFEPGAPLRSLQEMVDTYHATVGANTVLELDFAVDRTGNIAPSHAALYAALGAWRRACYGQPLATAQLAPGAATLLLPLPGSGPAGQLMDRLVLQEPLAGGQCVANYSLEVLVVGSGGALAWQPFGRTGAHLIGNKRIELNGSGPGQLGPPLNATAARLNITATFATGCSPSVVLSAFAPQPCVPAPPPPPPPRARVRFLAPDGRCLATNATFPCYRTSCPLFLADCALATAVWDDGGAAAPGTLSNLGIAPPTPNVVNADCNLCALRTALKLEEGSPADIRYQGGQLRYACSSAPGGGLCIGNGLLGPPNTPCNPSEPVLQQQVQVASCSSEGTAWERVPA